MLFWIIYSDLSGLREFYGLNRHAILDFSDIQNPNLVFISVGRHRKLPKKNSRLLGFFGASRWKWTLDLDFAGQIALNRKIPLFTLKIQN